MQIELFIYWPSHSPPPTFSLHFLGATVPFAGAPWQQRDSSMRRRLGEVKFLMMSPNHVAKDETLCWNAPVLNLTFYSWELYVVTVEFWIGSRHFESEAVVGFYRIRFGFTITLLLMIQDRYHQLISITKVGSAAVLSTSSWLHIHLSVIHQRCLSYYNDTIWFRLLSDLSHLCCVQQICCSHRPINTTNFAVLWTPPWQPDPPPSLTSDQGCGPFTAVEKKGLSLNSAIRFRRRDRDVPSSLWKEVHVYGRCGNHRDDRSMAEQVHERDGSCNWCLKNVLMRSIIGHLMDR